MQSEANNDSANWSWPKLAVAIVVSLYFLWCAYDPYQWHLIDGVNLLIHEAGHLIFSPFGEFLMIAGGVLFAVGLVLTFAGRLPWLGRLPGDIVIARGPVTFYFPLATSIIISIALTLLFWLFRR